jgi:S1-C subfamily serine protease
VIGAGVDLVLDRPLHRVHHLVARRAADEALGGVQGVARVELPLALRLVADELVALVVDREDGRDVVTPVGPIELKTRLLSSLGGAAAVAGLFFAASPLLGLSPAARATNPRAETVHKVFPSAVRIQISAAGEVVRSASGIAFARDGERTYVLTNAHVVAAKRAWKEPVRIEVLPSESDGRVLAKVVATGALPDTDIAVLEVQGSLPVTPLGPDDELELGDDLVVIGAPFGKGLSVAAGIVSQVEYEFLENAAAARRAKSLKTDAAIGYGSSGGGVFDVPRGRLIGLVEGYRTARVEFGKDANQYAFDVPMPGETFVAPAAKIRRFLADKGFAHLADGRTDAVAGREKDLPQGELASKQGEVAARARPVALPAAPAGM